ncbi:MAG: tetratricopeptide repeat protein, partial [Cyanobacteria bacterium J06600_6]
MDEKRVQTYLNLINQLLTYPNQKEEILRQNKELLDNGFLQTATYFAQMLQEKGKEQPAGFLYNLIHQLFVVNVTQNKQEDYIDFLLKILPAIRNGATQEQIYLLFHQNLDKLNLQSAQTLRIWANKTFPTLKPEQQQGIGYDIYKYNVLIQKFPLGNRAGNLEIAITGYEILLSIFTQKDFPENWARIQNSLGAAYRERIKGNKVDNLEIAITSYERALIIYTQKDFPVDWADTQNNLGNAYISRIKGDKADNLETAIACYERALIIHTQQDFPAYWATTQHNLGNAYSDRIKGDKADNLETAISSFERALIIRTQQDFPYNWATTQNNLGNVYSARIKGDKANNLETAIACYKRALIIHTQQDFPYDWATTQNNLGNVYSARIKGNKADNL